MPNGGIVEFQLKGGSHHSVSSLHHRAISMASNVCSSECEHGVEVEACAFCQRFRKAVCFVNADKDQLLTQMLDHLSAIQEMARYYYLHQFQRVFLTLDKNISVLCAQKAEKKDDCKGCWRWGR